MIEFIEFLRTKHRATLHSLYDEGKTYRSRRVARELGYLSALIDIQDAIELPEKNRQLPETMKQFGKMLKR